MTLLKYGEMRKSGFAPAFDLVVYGFSSGKANEILGRLGNPRFERGELLKRLRHLERTRRLPDGFTTCLTKDEVIAFVCVRPDVLMERSSRERPRAIAAAAPMTDDDMQEMGQKARNLISMVNLMSDRSRMMRIQGQEWRENPSMLLQRDVGIEFC